MCYDQTASNGMGNKVCDRVASSTKFSVVLTNLGCQILNSLHVELHKNLSLSSKSLEPEKWYFHHLEYQ